jgi:hypothetical protein
MPYLTPSNRAVAALVIASHLLVATGCTSWKTRHAEVSTVITPPPQVPQAPVGPATVPGLAPVQPGYAARTDTARLIRITTAAHDTVELRNPRVANDSVYGQVKQNGPEMAFPVSEITSVQTKGGSAGKTVLLVGGALAVTFGVLVAATAASLCAGAPDC